MNRGRLRQWTASRTMILLDPDLDQPPGPPAKKALSSPESRKAERDARLPSVRTLSRFLKDAQAAVRLKGMVSVLLTTDKKIKTLNRDFRRKNKATDVLSFPAADVSRGEVAGDLAISVDTALRQGTAFGHSLTVELKVLMLHGLLHLAGFDHEIDDGEMARKERRLRGKLGLPVGLIERAGSGTAAGKGSWSPTLATKTKTSRGWGTRGRAGSEKKRILPRRSGQGRDEKVLEELAPLKMTRVEGRTATAKRGRQG